MGWEQFVFFSSFFFSRKPKTDGTFQLSATNSINGSAKLRSLVSRERSLFLSLSSRETRSNPLVTFERGFGIFHVLNRIKESLAVIYDFDGYFFLSFSSFYTDADQSVGDCSVASASLHLAMKLPQYSNGCRSARSLITAIPGSGSPNIFVSLSPRLPPPPQTFNFLGHSLSLCELTTDSPTRRRFSRIASAVQRTRWWDLNPFVRSSGLFVCAHDETRNYQTAPIRFRARLMQVDVIRIIGENCASVSDQREIFIPGHRTAAFHSWVTSKRYLIKKIDSRFFITRHKNCTWY